MCKAFLRVVVCSCLSSLHRAELVHTLPCTHTRDDASSTSPVIHASVWDKESSMASAVTGWRPEPRFRSAGLQVMWELPDFADRCYHSSQLWRGVSELEFRTQPPYRTELENLEVSASFRVGGRTQPALRAASRVCVGCVAATKEPKCELHPAAPPRPAPRAAPTQMLQCRNLRAQALVSHRVPTAPTLQ